MLLDWRCYRDVFASLLILTGFRGQATRVFAVGLNKTGTSSIHETFINLGYHATHNATWCDKYHPFELMAFQAFSNGNPVRFKTFDSWYPGSKFILNVRGLEDWLDSRLSHLNYHVETAISHKSKQVWNTDDDMVRHSILHRNRHHLRVLNHFTDRPDDLLVLNYNRDPDALEKVALFLDKNMAGMPKEKPHIQPTSNIRNQSSIRFDEQITRVFTKLDVPEIERSYDIYCPSLVENPADNNWVPDTSMRLD